ncbi:18623_t:CDS:2, partial [Gigaspora margarita]
DPLFFFVDESNRLANSICSKKCHVEDLPLTELLEEEKGLDKVEETSKQVITELKLPKNLNSISALKSLKEFPFAKTPKTFKTTEQQTRHFTVLQQKLYKKHCALPYRLLKVLLSSEIEPVLFSMHLDPYLDASMP